MAQTRTLYPENEHHQNDEGYVIVNNVRETTKNNSQYFGYDWKPNPVCAETIRETTKNNSQYFGYDRKPNPVCAETIEQNA